MRGPGRSLLVALATGLLLAVPAQAANPVVAAAKRSADARTTTVQFRSATTLPGLGGFVTSGTGAQRGNSAKLTMRTEGGGRAVEMDAVALAEQGSFVLYIRSPLLQAQLPPGKTWVRYDLQEAGARLGLDVSALVGSTQSLAPLWHGLVSTKNLGTEVVSGEPATHYRAVVDYRRAAARVPSFAEQLAVLERTTGVRLGRVTADVWVGADRRIRRFSTVTPTRVQGVRGRTVQTITYLAYDVPVSIVAPPGASVFSPRG